VTSGVRGGLTPELAADTTPDARQLVRSTLGTGRIQGLLDARDTALPELADQLAELGELVRFALNEAHNAASALPPPATLAGTRRDLSGWDGAANAGTAYLAVVDRVSGATVASVALDMTVPMANDIVAQINTGLTGTATASIGADGALRITTADPAHGLALAEGDSAIEVADGAGRTRVSGFSHFFGLNDLVVADGERLGLRADIAADPARIAAAMLDVAAGPPLVATLGGGGDNRGALALAAALDSPVVVAGRGGLPPGRFTMSGYVADLTAHAAQRTAAASDAVDTASTLVDSLAYRAGSVSGVNTDEELARLITFQQAYTVSARIIAITDQLFDELVRLKG
jgi:flagellar hook-associated protein 1 FlgK